MTQFNVILSVSVGYWYMSNTGIHRIWLYEHEQLHLLNPYYFLFISFMILKKTLKFNVFVHLIIYTTWTPICQTMFLYFMVNLIRGIQDMITFPWSQIINFCLKNLSSEEYLNLLKKKRKKKKKEQYLSKIP
jgi:hypothetical protein